MAYSWQWLKRFLNIHKMKNIRTKPPIQGVLVWSRTKYIYITNKRHVWDTTHDDLWPLKKYSPRSHCDLHNMISMECLATLRWKSWLWRFPPYQWQWEGWVKLTKTPTVLVHIDAHSCMFSSIVHDWAKQYPVYNHQLEYIVHDDPKMHVA